MNKAIMEKPMWTPEKIRSLRKLYCETQVEFCVRVGVTPHAIRIWEQGNGTPNGSALVLLDILEEDLDEGRIRVVRNKSKSPAFVG